ncbi:hypothetical protein HHI36_003388 [Cryptolaemus montrouzieri]|uniref:Uncharacterized protein n=1 Tax=Cryptolaemus montrouzieri TaxID=559131 RepID=A0ABD2PDH5_9CUCU
MITSGTKLRTLFYKIQILRYILERKQMRLVYFVLVESHLGYGILGWEGILDVHTERLQITQKKILKIMSNKTISYSTDALFVDIQILDICQLISLEMCVRIKAEKRTDNARNQYEKQDQQSSFNSACE